MHMKKCGGVQPFFFFNVLFENVTVLVGGIVCPRFTPKGWV
jgi:hypothetical protein